MQPGPMLQKLDKLMQYRVCVCVHMCTCVHVCVHTFCFACESVCILVCVLAYACLCVCVWARARVHVRVICVCLYCPLPLVLSGNVAHHSLLVKGSFFKFISLTVLKQHRISSQSDFKERAGQFSPSLPWLLPIPLSANRLEDRGLRSSPRVWQEWSGTSTICPPVRWPPFMRGASCHGLGSFSSRGHIDAGPAGMVSLWIPPPPLTLCVLIWLRDVSFYSVQGSHLSLSSMSWDEFRWVSAPPVWPKDHWTGFSARSQSHAWFGEDSWAPAQSWSFACPPVAGETEQPWSPYGPVSVAALGSPLVCHLSDAGKGFVANFLYNCPSALTATDSAHAENPIIETSLRTGTKVCGKWLTK